MCTDMMQLGIVKAMVNHRKLFKSETLAIMYTLCSGETMNADLLVVCKLVSLEGSEILSQTTLIHYNIELHF